MASGQIDLSYTTVGDRFIRGAKFASTRTSEAFEAVDQELEERVVLWLLRYPLVFGSDIANQFSNRLKLLNESPIDKIGFKYWGVDARGTAFLVTDYVRGTSIFSPAMNLTQLQGLFLQMADSVAAIHSQSQVLSDLCAESFLLDSAGRPHLWALLGPFESGAKQTAALPPAETLHFLSPEQRTLSAIDPTIDVYALGILAYRLFTGRYPLAGRQLTAENIPDLTAVAPAPSTLRQDLPAWSDDIIGNCLAPRSEQRFPDANELARALRSALEHGESVYGNTRWSRRTVSVRGSGTHEGATREVSTYVVGNSGPGGGREVGAPRAQAPGTYKGRPTRPRPVDVEDSRVRAFTWLVALVVGLLVAGVLFLVIDHVNKPPEQSASLTDVVNNAPQELKPLLVDATAPGLPFERREKAIEKLSQSSNPKAYATLLRLRNGGLEANLVRSLEKFLFTRLESDRMVRVAATLRRFWSEGGMARISPEVFSNLLLACDRQLSFDSRKKTLEDSLKVDADRTTEVVASLALDESEQTFIPVLREFLGKSAGQTEVSGRGIGALILATNHLNKAFQKDLAEWLPRISDEDLRWSLVHLAEHENRSVFDLAREMARRKMLPPYQSIVLDAVIKLEKMPVDVPLQGALVRSALNGWDGDALQIVGQWMAPNSEQVLLSAMATAQNPDVATKAFDILAGRTMQQEPGKTFVSWVKTQLWDSRVALVKPLGILSLDELATDDELSYALDQFLNASSPGLLFRVSRASGDARVLGIIVRRFGERLPSQDLLDLLESPSREIRLSTVRGLRGRNELVVLQRILRAYDKEEDPELRKAYEENHWVTRERVKQE